MAEYSLHKLALLVGRTKRLLEEGKSSSEISDILKVPEYDVLKFKAIINSAETKQSEV